MHYFLKLESVTDSSTSVIRINTTFDRLSRKPLVGTHFVKNVVEVDVPDYEGLTEKISTPLPQFAVFEEDGVIRTIPKEEVEDLKNL